MIVIEPAGAVTGMVMREADEELAGRFVFGG